ncbi:probable serine/threonine-protein kinase DDB_G0271682 [Oppia nitens]|uniref:probable serine/threonine-protein kinase DDB_G0271682 n=1 Tax=Oppia nitens TaxID=1686743 RepID=UPI0023DA4FA0|nr:probable serine/threonine-protein kinase DDB_G0271682 [Oppia nitens]
MEYCLMSLKEAIKLKAQVFNRQSSDEPMDCMEYYITCELLLEVLECVRYLHELKPPVIHRDIKPDNILIADDIRNGRFIKLCDLGFITVHEMVSQSHTSGVGSPKYMAPEVISGRKYDTKADVYSISVIIEELFDTNVNDSRDKYIKHEWSNKYCKLLDVINESMKPIYDERPTCAEIIEQYNEWAIDSTVVTSDIKIDEKLEKIKHKERELRSEDRDSDIERFYIYDDELGVNVLFVTTDDRVYGLGANYYGSLGLGHNQWVSEPQEIIELRHKNCGLNVWGELGNGCRDFETNKPMIVKINDLILDVSCGSYHTLVVTQNNNNNEVYGWGKNKFGQIGSRDTTCDSITLPEKIEFNGDYCIKCVQCFEQSSFALTMDGQVFSWGQNRSQQLGLNISNDFIVKPQLICNLSGITSIQSGSLNTYFSSHYNNQVYFCGQYYTNNNNNISDIQLIPKLLGTFHEFSNIQSNFYI